MQLRIHDLKDVHGVNEYIQLLSQEQKSQILAVPLYLIH